MILLLGNMCKKQGILLILLSSLFLDIYGKFLLILKIMENYELLLLINMCFLVVVVLFFLVFFRVINVHIYAIHDWKLRYQLRSYFNRQLTSKVKYNSSNFHFFYLLSQIRKKITDFPKNPNMA